MQVAEKTKEELATEVAHLRQRVAELEQSDVERKQAEEALRKSEEKYRRVVEISPDGIAVASKGRHVFANKSLAKILGVSSPDELVGKPVMDYIHPDYRKIVRERLSQQTKRGELVPLLEEKMLRADGTVIHAEATAAPLKYEGEQAVLAVIRDITDRKQAEEELRKSEKMYRILVETIPHGIQEIDISGIITFANSGYHRMLGYEEGELIGKPMLSTIPHGSARKELQDYIEILINEQPIPTPWNGKVVTKDGKIREIQTDWNYKRDDEGRVMGFISIITDITERKLADETLKKSEEKYRLLNENIPVAVYSALPDEHSTNLFLSGQFSALTGYSIEQFFNDPNLWNSILHPEDRDFVWEKVDEHRRTKRILEVEYRIVTKDKKVKWIRDRAKPVLDENGTLVKIDGFMEDITQRKQAENALRESEEKYRSLVESSEDSIYLVDPKCNYIFLNNRHLSRLGVKLRQIIGRPYAEFHSPEESRDFAHKVKSVIKTGQSLSYEYRSQRDNRYFIRTLNPVTSADVGKIAFITVISKDITDRKQAEMALKESEERYHMLLDNIDAGINLMDVDHNIIMVNAFTEKIFNKPVSELIGKKCFQEFEKRDAACPHCPAVQTMATGQPAEVETEGVRDDGSRFAVRIQTVPVLDPDNTINGFIEFAEDITKRKEAEKERLAHLRLLESMDQFNRALQGTNDLDQMMSNALDALLAIFDCDRSWLLYPCDPEATSWRVPKECTNPEYPGVFAMGTEIPMDTGAAKMMQAALDSDAPVRYGPGLEYPLPGKEPERFGIQSQLAMAIYPKVGKPWLFGLHQCSYVRVWTPQEEQIFQEIGRRLTDSLTSLLVYRDLQESEERLKILFEFAPDGYYVSDLKGTFIDGNRAAEEITGYKREQLIGKSFLKVKLLPKHQIPRAAAHLAQNALGKPTGPDEFTLKRKDGSQVPLEIRAYPIKIKGQTQVLGIARDITGRKQAEEKLREREAFNYALFKYNPIETIVVDLEGKVTGFNLAKEQSGDRLPAIGDQMYKDYAGKHEIDMRVELMKCIRSGKRKEFPEQKYGDKYLTITISPFTQGAIIISENITEPKQAEELLQEERDTLYSILEKAPYGVMVEDAHGKFSLVNSEFTNITGYTLEDIPNRQKWLHRAYPDQSYRNMVQKMWKKDYTQTNDQETFQKRFKKLFSRVFTVMCKDGAAKDIEFRATARANGGTIFMLSDITERQRMHDLLQTSASEWRTTFDAINDAVCLLDPHGKIIRCNNAMLQLIGKPFSQITNHHCWELIHGVSRAPNSCPIALVGKTHHRETEVMFKDSRWLNISVDPLLDEDGNILGGVHIMSDITDRMRIQHELQDSREQLRNLTVYLQSVREQERTNIAREIHDELAQALTALKMDVSWIDHRLPSNARSLSEKTKSMGKLIDSTIHTVKRISAELRPGILDDLGLVAAIEWQAEEFQNRTGINCNLTVDPPDLTVDQDRSTAIFRIFQETLTNVARHAQATRVSVSLKERGAKLTLRVRDNGTGITEEQIAAPQSFGLIGIRERVHPWGGKVSIKGIPAKGTTVTVNLEQAYSKHDVEKIELKGSPS